MKKLNKKAKILFCTDDRLKAAYQKYCAKKGWTMTVGLEKYMLQVTKYKVK